MMATKMSTRTKTKEIQSNIKLYESLCLTSEKMMMSAERGEWDDIISHEIKHQEIYNQLQGFSKDQLLEAKDIEQKADLIKKILAMDRQTQRLVKDRVKNLQKRVEGERKIRQAYKL